MTEVAAMVQLDSSPPQIDLKMMGSWCGYAFAPLFAHLFNLFI
jgi:hypothetical protein